jgi:hypothetical protein
VRSSLSSFLLTPHSSLLTLTPPSPTPTPTPTPTHSHFFTMLSGVVLASVLAGASSVVAAPTSVEPRALFNFPPLTTTSGAWTATTCAFLSFSFSSILSSADYCPCRLHGHPQPRSHQEARHQQRQDRRRLRCRLRCSDRLCSHPLRFVSPFFRTSFSPHVLITFLLTGVTNNGDCYSTPLSVPKHPTVSLSVCRAQKCRDSNEACGGPLNMLVYKRTAPVTEVPPPVVVPVAPSTKIVNSAFTCLSSLSPLLMTESLLIALF